MFLDGLIPHKNHQHRDSETLHLQYTVPQKYLLTSTNYCNTVIAIGRNANGKRTYAIEKQMAVISALAEGSGIRQIERMTGVHRDTIMRLGVRVGKGCASLLRSQDAQPVLRATYSLMRFGDSSARRSGTFDRDDNPKLGDVWTFCAIDPDTKLVPSFKVGKRDPAHGKYFRHGRCLTPRQSRPNFYAMLCQPTLTRWSIAFGATWISRKS